VEVPVQVWFPEGGPHKGMSLRKYQNLRGIHNPRYKNLHVQNSPLLWEHIRIGVAHKNRKFSSSHYLLQNFSLGRCFKAYGSKQTVV
jgi:hypothetical protein